MADTLAPKVGLMAAFIHAPLKVLGPGTRVGLWVRGCTLACEGCLSPELAVPDKLSLRPVSQVASEMIKLADKHLAYRVTISGGEPFQQAVALKELILLLRAGGIKDILVYSGYPFKELRVRYPWIERSLSALVDGPFELAHPTDLAWKGSEGQKFYLFDPGLKESYDAWLGLKARRLQIIPLLEGVLVLGIPKLGDYQG